MERQTRQHLEGAERSDGAGDHHQSADRQVVQGHRHRGRQFGEGVGPRRRQREDRSGTSSSPPRASPKSPDGGWLCPNALNATPVIDRATSTVYVLGGRRQAARLERLQRRGPRCALPVHASLLEDVEPEYLGRESLYTTVSQGCNGARSAIYAVNLKDPDHKVMKAISSPTGGAGIWGRAGAAVTSTGLAIGETGRRSVRSRGGQVLGHLLRRDSCRAAT